MACRFQLGARELIVVAGPREFSSDPNPPSQCPVSDLKTCVKNFARAKERKHVTKECQNICHKIPKDISKNMSERMSKDMPKCMPEGISGEWLKNM